NCEVKVAAPPGAGESATVKAGAGAGNGSMMVPKLAGRYAPAGTAPESVSVAEASSLSVMVADTRSLVSPTSENNTSLEPSGATSRMSTSSGNVCETPYSVT